MLLASLKLCFHGLYLPNWTPGVQWISRLRNYILDPRCSVDIMTEELYFGSDGIKIIFRSVMRYQFSNFALVFIANIIIAIEESDMTG